MNEIIVYPVYDTFLNLSNGLSAKTVIRTFDPRSLFCFGQCAAYRMFGRVAPSAYQLSFQGFRTPAWTGKIHFRPLISQEGFAAIEHARACYGEGLPLLTNRSELPIQEMFFLNRATRGQSDVAALWRRTWTLEVDGWRLNPSAVLLTWFGCWSETRSSGIGTH